MIKVAFVSVLGGQGKTTLVTLLARLLHHQGVSTLVIDLDPFRDVSYWLGFEPAVSVKTLADLAQGGILVEELVVSVPGAPHLGLLSGSESLRSLENAPAARLERVQSLLLDYLNSPTNPFAVCLIDVPPQLVSLNQLALRCADQIVVPAEASLKGYSSVIHTLNLLSGLGLGLEKILAVFPTRDRWIGSKRSQESRIAIESMIDEVGENKVYPSLRESEIFKRSINQNTTPAALGAPDLEQAIQNLLHAIAPFTEAEKPAQKPKKSRKSSKKSS